MVARVSPKEFVKVWETSNSIKEVEQKTGMHYNAILGRVRMYRRPVFDKDGRIIRQGLDLKPMLRENTNRIDVEKLREVIRKMQEAQ